MRTQRWMRPDDDLSVRLVEHKRDGGELSHTLHNHTHKHHTEESFARLHAACLPKVHSVHGRARRRLMVEGYVTAESLQEKK
jgi:hypothetical protein